MNRLLPVLAFTIIATAGATTLAIADNGAVNKGTHDHHVAHANHTPLAADPVDHDDSLFHLDAEWRTQRGDSFRLADLAGRPTVITMIYGTCNTACPILVNDARRIREALPEAHRDELQVVIVSFDPERDTPEAMTDYAATRKLEGDRWHFLHGDDMDIRTLAALLGVRYRENGDGTFDHSNLVALLDPSGRIARREEGLMQPVESMAGRIVEMFKATAQPQW